MNQRRNELAGAEPQSKSTQGPGGHRICEAHAASGASE